MCYNECGQGKLYPSFVLAKRQMNLQVFGGAVGNYALLTARYV